MKRYAKKRNYKRKKYVKKSKKPHMSRITTTKSNTLSSDRTFVKMTYADNQSNAIRINAGGVYGSKTFVGNTIYQPNGSLTGTPALGYYEYKSLYNKYRVLGSKITCNFFAPIGLDTADESYYRITIVPTDLAGWNTKSIQHCSELPYAKTQVLSPLVCGNGSKVQMKHYISTCKMEGSKTPRTDISFASAFGTNPPNMFFWHINVAKLSGVASDTAILIGAEIRITYYVELYSRIDNAFDEADPISYDIPLFYQDTDTGDGTVFPGTIEPENSGPIEGPAPA